MRKAALFVALAVLGSYLLALLFYLPGGRLGTPPGVALAVVYMFMPAVAAVVAQRLVYHQPIRGPLGISWRINRWWLVGWLLPPAIAFLTIAVSLLFPQVRFSPDMAGMFDPAGDLQPD